MRTVSEGSHTYICQLGSAGRCGACNTKVEYSISREHMGLLTFESVICMTVTVNVQSTLSGKINMLSVVNSELIAKSARGNL